MELPKFLKFLELSSENSLKLLNSNNNRTKRFLSFIGVLNLNKVTSDTRSSTTTNKSTSNSHGIFHEIDLKETTQVVNINPPKNIQSQTKNTISAQNTWQPAKNINNSQKMNASSYRDTKLPNTQARNIQVITKTTEKPYYNPQAAEIGASIRGPASPQTHTSAKKVADELTAQQDTNTQKSATPITPGMTKVPIKKVIRTAPGQTGHNR